MATLRHLCWERDTLVVLDQRLLPGRMRTIRCRSAADVAKAIKDMALRGAPLIGGAAAYGYVLAAKALKGVKRGRWQAALDKAAEELLAARPTAVNLKHGVLRMSAKAALILGRTDATASGLVLALKLEADAIFNEDVAANRRMAALGAPLIPQGSSVITHCNTGVLATCGIGTAFGVIHEAWRQRRVRHVYACETRPYLQGSRLTLWELMRAKVPSTLITDNMAAHLMGTEPVGAVLVGADRIAANGDAANKIGTRGLAILARYHNVPFYVVAPSTTVDLATPDGASIPIEERSASEVILVQGRPIAPAGAKARHPAFDITPHELITAIVTEKGVVRPVDGEHLKAVMSQ